MASNSHEYVEHSPSPPSVERFLKSTAASALDGQTAQSRNARTEKTYHILEAFGVVTSRIQSLHNTMPEEEYALMDEVYTKWMRYYQDVGSKACKLIEYYFVDYFSGERWIMKGVRGSHERLDSVGILSDIAFEGLGQAINMYIQRHATPQSTTPPASGDHLNNLNPTPYLEPIPFQYPNVYIYERFYLEGRLILPFLENEPPSPSGSSGARSNFSMDSDVMFPIEKD